MTIRLFLVLLLGVVPAACQTLKQSDLPARPRQASYACTGGVTLDVTHGGAGVSASDSRGFNAAMPASPPGQSARFAEGIYALILDGPNATWFVQGQVPMECRR